MSTQRHSPDQRCVLVTGSCSGIGLATAMQFARRDDCLVVVCGLTAEDLAAARRAFEEESLQAVYLPLDLREDESIRSLQADLTLESLQPAVLVNNAAVMPPFLPEPTEPDFFALDADRLREVLEVNMIGTMRLCRAFVPGMLEAGYGRVVNVASEAASLTRMLEDPWPYSPSYRMSKVGVNALTRLLAREVAGRGVLVNSVCPGWVRTAMGGEDALLDPVEATRTILYLADLPDDGPNGGFFSDMRPYGFPNEVPW